MQKYFYVETDKPTLSYKCGETITFKVYARNNIDSFACPYVEWKIVGDDLRRASGLGEIRKDRPLVITATCDRPGFVRLMCTAKRADGSVDPEWDAFDGGAGVEPERVEYCDTLPESFDKYWGEIEQMIADFTPELVECTPVTAEVPDDFDCFDVRISTPIDGMVASGYLSLPKTGDKLKLKINFMGYSVVGANKVFEDGYAVLVVNAHGIENHLPRIVVEHKYKNLSGYGFNDKENESPYNTYWRNMMIRNLSATKWLSNHDRWDKNVYIAAGGSQGALQATTVAAYNDNITFLDISIPWFCNLNGENRGYMGGWRPKFAEGLRYFDTAAQATRVKCPVKIVAYLGDYVCPPSSIMALYNNFNVNKSLDFVQNGTHSYRPPQRVAFRLHHDPELVSDEIKIGRYRHFKGGEYEVLGVAYNSETLENTVVYRALYGEGATWTRPASMWNELVEHRGKLVRRFEFVGE